ncbi:hypothetical protein SPHS8_00874 [Sphingobium sp. S8]|nr:hypothetical protein SPHS8_00874 [Sphingobium sp. S8]
MRLAQEHLIFKALCVLDDAVDQAQQAPVQPAPGLRFALAYLWSVSRSSDQRSFVSFWRSAVGKERGGRSDHVEDIARFNEVRASFSSIARSVGFEPTVAFHDALRRARGLTTYPSLEERLGPLQNRASPNGHVSGKSDPA